MKKPVRVLCIGGSDSSGGAGIQADLKAVHASGCYGLSVVTAVTAQNSVGVQDIYPVPHAFVSRQLDSILSDIGVEAVKTGMLWKEESVRTIAREVKAYKIKNLVVDPVMIAKGGYELLEDRAKKTLIKNLLPLAFVVTPNIPEAEYLTKMKIKSVDNMKKAAEVIFSLGAKNVLIKGGHLPGSKKKGSIDILFDGKNYHELRAEWIKTKNTHGTGCTFASALAAGLALGKDVYDAADFAKIMVTKAIINSVPLGKGHGAVNAGMPLISLKKKHECLNKLQEACNYLMSFKCGNLIPEVSSNLVYAKANAKNENQVAGFPGIILRLYDAAYAAAQPEFGASKHMTHVVLTVMKYDPSCRSVMNIKYSKEIIKICRKIGFSVKSFDRKEEPKERKEREGFSLEWGVNKVLAQNEMVPDIIYDEGGWGKEPMVRVFGKNPIDVVKKVKIISERSL